MKKYFSIAMLCLATMMTAQEKTFEEQVKLISKNIDKITSEEKLALKKEVQQIHKQLESKKITFGEAEELKKEAAKKHAEIIENKVAVEEKKLQLLVQDKINGKIASHDTEHLTFNIGRRSFKIKSDGWDGDKWDNNRHRKKRHFRNRRTTSQFVLAVGLNNVIKNDAISHLENSDHKMWQSHFYELGWTYKKRMVKTNSPVYFKYGFSFLWNNLRATDNRYYVKSGDQTNLIVHPEALSESRLRNVQLIFPLHFEFDFSKPRKYDDYTRYRTHKAFRFGVGGYGGVRVRTKQILKYKANDLKVKEKIKGNYNMNNLTYGLSSYIGYRSTSFYVKYDMNSLFKSTDQRNVSFGVRFDWN